MLQENQLALVSSQPIQCGPKVVQVLPRMDGRHCRLRRLVCTSAIVGTNALVATIAQQDVEPRVELTGLVKPPQVPECVDKRGLGSVGSVGVVAGERSSMRERAPLIPWTRWRNASTSPSRHRRIASASSITFYIHYPAKGESIHPCPFPPTGVACTGGSGRRFPA